MPVEFGNWNTQFKRFNEGAKKDIVTLIFAILAKKSDAEWLFINGSYIKTHQPCTGAIGNEGQAIGQGRAGNIFKIHLAVDTHGLLIHFEVTGGAVHDCSAAPERIEGLPQTTAIIADKGDEVYQFELVQNLNHQVPNLIIVLI